MIRFKNDDNRSTSKDSMESPTKELKFVNGASQRSSMSSAPSRRRSTISNIIYRKMSGLKTFNGNKRDFYLFHNVEIQKTQLRENMRFWATAMFCLAVIASSMAIGDTEVTLHLEAHSLEKTRNMSFSSAETKSRIKVFTLMEHAMKTGISILSIMICSCLVMFYRNMQLMKILRNFYPPGTSFLQAKPYAKVFLFEFCLCLVHVPPFVWRRMAIPPQLQVIVTLRLYLVLRFIKEQHQLMKSQSTRFLASVTKTNLTPLFLFKTFFFHYPFQTIVTTYLIILFVGGYGVWLIENRQMGYLDTVWMLIVTMTTVGFGDLTPSTPFGRFIIGMAAILGIFLMALFITLVNEALMLTKGEKRILAHVRKHGQRKRLHRHACNAIGSWYRYHSLRKRLIACKEGVGDPPKIGCQEMLTGITLETQMYEALNGWRRAKASLKESNMGQDFVLDDLRILLTNVSRQVDSIEEQMQEFTGGRPSSSNSNKSFDTPEIKESPQPTSIRNPSPPIKRPGILRNPSFPGNLGNQKTENVPVDCHVTTQNDKYEKNNGSYGSRSIIKRCADEEKHALMDDQFFSDEEDQTIGDQLKRLHTHGCNSNIQSMNPLKGCREKTSNFQNLRQLIKDNADTDPVKVDSLVGARQYLEAALPLLLNQNKIMQNTLDEIYTTTKQELSYFETVLKSLTVMTGIRPTNSDDVHCHINKSKSNRRVTSSDKSASNIFDCNGQICSSVST